MNPLNRVCPDARLCINSRESMQQRPALAVKVATCIAEWADIENIVGLVLGQTLDTSYEAAVAMWNALENRAAQLRMFEAAIKARLSPDHAEVVLAIVQNIVRPAMRDRDRLAHWCWAYSLDLPNALLLVEPSQWLINLVQMTMEFTRNPHIATDHIYVITEGDMDRTLSRFAQARETVGRITGTVWSSNRPEQRVRFLEELANMPHVREARDRWRRRCSTL